MLITEFYGDTEQELRSKLANLTAHLKQEKIPATVVPAISPAQQRNVWKVRKVGLGLLMSIKGDHKPVPFIEDAAVPVEHLANYISQLEDFCGDLGVSDLLCACQRRVPTYPAFGQHEGRTRNRENA